MLKAYKYRLYPNNEQKVMLAKTFGCVRLVYNKMLNERIETYKEYKDDKEELKKQKYPTPAKYKNDYPFLKEIDSLALANAQLNLDKAYKKFFKEGMGFPKFKSKKEHNYSYTTNMVNGNIKLEGNMIKLPKVGFIEVRFHRKFEGVIKSCTISQVPSGKYYISILVDTENIQAPKNNKVYAFDLGLKEFLIDSKGEHIENPKTIYKYEEKLSKLQRKIAHKQKGSGNWCKARIKIARLHEKITNIRKDFLNKLSSKIINENQVIISEDLNIKGMLKNHNLAKAVSDVSWGEFTRQLEYKAKWKGRTYHKIDRWFASSQTCSKCGSINKEVKLLSIREWLCESCGEKHQRDENAAKNIKMQGMKELGLV